MASRVHRIMSKGGSLGIGASQSLYLHLNAIAKANTVDVPYCVPNEMICAAIGRFLCLPLPPCGIVGSTTDPTEIWFASLDFNMSGIGLPPVNPPDLVAQLPSEATGLILFDILIANCDRHAQNITFDQQASPRRLTVFDHSHALLGYHAAGGIARLQALQDRLAITGQPPTGGNRHCLLDIIPTDVHMRTWIERVRQLPDFLIHEACDEVVGPSLNQAEANAVKDFVKHRRDNLPAIIQANRQEFRSVVQWSLI